LFSKLAKLVAHIWAIAMTSAVGVSTLAIHCDLEQLKFKKGDGPRKAIRQID
jgi:hypothetical protein